MNSLPAITVSEAVDLLRQLEPRVARDLTERQLRYTATMLGLASGHRGATMLLTRVDLVLVRMLLRLEAYGLSRPLARFAAVTVAPEVRAVFEKGRPVTAIVVVPVVATYPKVRRPILTTEGEAKRLRLGGVFVSLQELAAGLLEGMREIRAEQPTVWQWKPVGHVAASTMTYQLQQEEDEDREFISI